MTVKELIEHLNKYPQNIEVRHVCDMGISVSIDEKSFHIESDKDGNKYLEIY